ncbi:large-conductance mechanosensitive channel [Rhizoclosmatium globosum]|uniref:Large-conductance mechanosensitive channel n=1 Tax=Rhizoclosmatium globosum TaxID=329046 RepID=A0A1Y2CD35_9FUNG|nr:large-conductance mechanosensitive channel [Rhizoclosmatium globosum]|eukprot:ORY44225.1 large-conductance mechanosensitive channel [Rhizoclosmatium globosum]
MSTKIDIPGSKAVGGFFADFKTFLMRGSLVDLAVGIIVGGAFNVIVQSFVNDLISPVIGLIGQKNLENLFLIMKCSDKSLVCKTGSNDIYPTIAAAALDGAATWNYGRFLQNVIYFVIVAFVMFLVVKAYAKFLDLSKKEEVAAAAVTTKKCEACLEEIHLDAKKCKFCASSV